MTALVSLFFYSYANSQQFLNLDFEKKSIEGIARPWGWSYNNSTNSAIMLDSTIYHKGKYSLKVVGGTNTEALKSSSEIEFSIEGYELAGHFVTFEGWIKTNSIEGTAGFTTHCFFYQDEPIQPPSVYKSKEITGTNDWQLVSVTVQIPDSTRTIHLRLHMVNTGTAWFDDFSLIVNKSRKEQVEIDRRFTSPELRWLNKNSYKIKKIDASIPGAASELEDLAFLKNLIGNARVIAIGESTHGTSEFFRLKHRVLEYAIKELGVRIFAMEDHQLVMDRVNKYVLGGPGTSRQCMYGMFSVWQNEEVHNMIKWIRAYNDEHPGDKVEIAGFDIQNIRLPLDSLFAFIKTRAPELSGKIESLLGDLSKDGANYFMAPDSTKLSWFNNAYHVYELVLGYQPQWLKSVKNRTDSLSVFRGVQYANLVKQYAENVYKGHLSFYRDVAMADNISWILSQQKPGARILVWAHDYHISRGDHTDNNMNIYNGISMGSHLSKKYKTLYKAFAMYTYKGDYRGQISYSNFKMVRCPLYESPGGSLDEALHQTILKKKTPALFLNLTQAWNEKWLTRPLATRFANHVNIEYGYWTKYSIPFQFDGIFFIDTTSSAKTYGVTD